MQVSLNVKESDKSKKSTQASTDTASNIKKDPTTENSQGFFSRLLQSRKKNICK